MTDKFILDENGEPKPEPDLYKWGTWMQRPGIRVVKQEKVGETKVSTVFLGLNHNYEEGPPVLWETMIFSSEHPGIDQTQDRCSGTREQAEAMHERMMELVRGLYKHCDQPA